MLAVLLSFSSVLGHGAMVSPTSRNAIERTLPDYQDGRSQSTPCTCANGYENQHPKKGLLFDAAIEQQRDGPEDACFTDKGMNYNSHAHNIDTVHTSDSSACCDLCAGTDGCKFFTWTSEEGSCYLKNATTGRSTMHGATSGGIGPKPNFPQKGGGCDQGIRLGAGGQPCMWWSQGCSIGCDVCATAAGGTAPITGNAPHADKAGFRKRYCNSTMKATLPKHAWTLNLDAVEGSVNDSYIYNPWRAPGFAPVVDPCGQAGGRYPQTPVGGDSEYATTTFATMGDLGTKKLPEGPSMASWKAGSSVVVSWGMRYNHGGGYQYRIAPLESDLTEKTFQKMPLAFDTTKQTLVWNNGTRYPIDGIFVNTGTMPAGSTWARNPIPRVQDDNIGLQDAAGCPGPSGRSGPRCIAFPAPCPQDTGRYPWSTDGSGQGACSGDWTAGVIEDTVIVPKDAAPGKYLLSWRWDAEETAQVWQNCADITITA